VYHYQPHPTKRRFKAKSPAAICSGFIHASVDDNARVDRDAKIDEPGANGAFHLVDATIERFAILDERSKLG
jgi:hypothetical protein